MSFLFQGSAGQPIEWSGDVPAFFEYQNRFWAREIDLVDRDAKILYARVHWTRLLHNVRHERYKEALRIISNGNA